MPAREPIRSQRGQLVYLLHYSRRTRAGRQHYLGCTNDLARRLSQHQAAESRETAKAVHEKLKIQLAQTWPGGYELERELKTWFRSSRMSFGALCPYCPDVGNLAPQFHWMVTGGTYQVSWAPPERAG